MNVSNNEMLEKYDDGWDKTNNTTTITNSKYNEDSYQNPPEPSVHFQR